MTHLRPACPTDAGALADILSGFIDETPWMPRVHSRAQDLAHMGELIDRGWVTLAQAGRGTAGFIAREDGMIHALYLHPDHRGQGIGSALLNHAKHETRQLDLWTFQANSGAQRFYERHGFCEAQRTDGAGNDVHLPDIRYVWSATGGPND
jgi:GNAT superfamily N-acetyltransferase